MRDLPYRRSALLTGFEWVGPAARYPGSGSDMHWWTWGDDDALYVVDDDGENFGNPVRNTHLLRVTGIPPRHEVTEVTWFPELKSPLCPACGGPPWWEARAAGSERSDCPACGGSGLAAKRRYIDGALAVGGRLFAAIYDYDYTDETGKPSWFADAMSRHAGVVAIMYSDDYGRTWHNVPDEDAPYFLGPRFAGLAFVGFGPGYTGVPPELDGFVYAISNDLSWESGDHIFLARVRKESVLDRAAWEFFADGGWVTDEDGATPILSDPGFVGHPTMTYDRAIGRFLLAFGSDSVPHRWDTPAEVAEATWHRQREFKLLEGAAPWGPFALVHYESAWEGDRVAYLPQIPSKWLSDDGLSGWLLFSGDYAYFRERPSPEVSFYGFMTRPFRLLQAHESRT